ncbi:MAG: hypothetical protein Q9186_001111 [Xanthomendoza sp. 1 TL-2023]
MDLVAGVRKEGSRGGRDAFKWEDVKDDQHRENYLGHSLMAPVGRWQRNKDLSWYAKGDDSKAATDAANARADEIRRIKEAEQDALSEALGYPVQPRLRDNQLAGQKEVEKALKETAEGDEEGGKGVGFGNYLGAEGVKHEDGSEAIVIMVMMLGDGRRRMSEDIIEDTDQDLGIDLCDGGLLEESAEELSELLQRRLGETRFWRGYAYKMFTVVEVRLLSR